MAVHMRNGIQYGGIPNGTVKGVNPSTVPTTVKQLNQIGTVGNIAPVTIPSAVKFSNGDTLETAIGSVATIETSPAVAAHDAGDYIFYNGQMYKVIAAIAVGETLTVDTNIEATSVGTELTQLNNGLIDKGRPINVNGWYQALFVAAWGLVVQIPMDTRKYVVDVGSGCQIYTPTGGWVSLPTDVTKSYGGSFVNIVFPATVLSGEYDGRVMLVNMAGLSVSER